MRPSGAQFAATLASHGGARLAGALTRPGGRWRSLALRRPTVGRLALIGVAAALNGCLPATNAGTLPPTLTVEPVRGGDVAFQNGIPVPSFGSPTRASVRLGGSWRVERTAFDSQLSLTPRESSLGAIETGAAGRQQPDYDDSEWLTLAVPGSLNPPPDRREIGGWYRRAFTVPESWVGRTLTLKFGAANYLADVWLNGTWLGYHEGGTTPFAFDATAAARPGERNVLAVRVDNPAWGTRNDIVPWGLADWWNFGGLTRPVWIEAAAPVHLVRADVVPHLDGADVSVVVRNAGDEASVAAVTVEVFPADAADPNPLDPDPRALLGADALSVIRTRLPDEALAPGDVVRLETSFLIDNAARWTPLSPSLYVLRVTVEVDGQDVDRLHETFGFRQVAVDPDGPAVLLNGRRVSLAGAALHDQVLEPGPGGEGRIPARAEILAQLRRAESIGIHLIRTGHTPANPDLLGLADRLGFAIWEEIPLYHYTPQTYQIAMRRGIPQQMLREMALRDMNRPSVLFHGLSNESTGEDARVRSLQELHDIDRAIDGTRLTGQAAYGFAPTDPTSGPLDVAGYTFYHGVFYGADAAADTATALEAAHRTYPDKPIVILEFGRWADGPNGLETQRRVFELTAPELFSRRASLPGGFLSAAVWWTLEDYATLRPNLAVEHFGLIDPAGNSRPVAAAARETFADLPQGIGASTLDPAPARVRPLLPTGSGRLLLVYLAYGAAMVVVLLGVVLGALFVRGGRGRRIPRPAPGGRPRAASRPR
jgi:beta-galactosidase